MPLSDVTEWTSLESCARAKITVSPERIVCRAGV
jgi:hypothetical protein